jgi:23S rRNA pseudouridine1911/1915/1917 synthase
MSQGQGPEKRAFEVSEGATRLDKFLADVCPDITRSQIQKLIQDGKVTVNAASERPSHKLKNGDRVAILIPAPEPASLIPEDIPFDVVYEDPDIVIINKPAGLAVHPAPGHPSHTLANALLKRFPDLAGFGASLRPGIVHRLDKDTSGLMVIARNEKARLLLVNEFKCRTVKKCYIVLVRGKLLPERGAIDAPIGRDPANRKRMAIVSKGREARTDYRVIEHLNGFSLVEARIQTGRTHQIRVHFAAIGHPVFGDPVYGVKSPLLGRQFLHAYCLELKLPSNGQTRSFTLDLPGDLKRVLRELSRR